MYRLRPVPWPPELPEPGTDGTRKATAINGHLLAREAFMTYAHREALRFVSACWLVGAVLGAIVGLVKERHA